MADIEEPVMASAAEEGATRGEDDRPDDRAQADLPLLWSSMDLPGMDSFD